MEDDVGLSWKCDDGEVLAVEEEDKDKYGWIVLRDSANRFLDETVSLSNKLTSRRARRNRRSRYVYSKCLIRASRSAMISFMLEGLFHW